MKAFLAKDETLSGIGLALALAAILIVTFSGQRSWILIGGALGVAALVLIAVDSFRKIPSEPPEVRPATLAPEPAGEPATPPVDVAEASRRGLALALELAEQAYRQGAYEAAASFLGEALEMARALGDQEMVAGILHNRGDALAALGRATGERHYFEEALADYSRSLELRPDHPATINNRGVALADLGRYAEALADYNRALELFEVAGNRRGVAMVQHNMGLVAAALEQWPEAQGLLSMALATFRELKLPQVEKTQGVLARIEAEELTAEVEEFLRQAAITMPAEPVLARR